MVNTNNEQIPTEERILKSAIKVFTEKGLNGSRMQDIANEAQINKSMLHYYYRNKQQLFERVFDEKITELFSVFEVILSSDLSFEQKIRKFVKTQIETISKIPGLPLFVINEVGKNPNILDQKFQDKGPKMLKGIFEKMIAAEISAGRIKPIDFGQFLANLLSLCLYPFVAKPMLQFVLDMDENNFNEFVTDRVELISDLLLNDVLIKQ